MAGEGILR